VRSKSFTRVNSFKLGRGLEEEEGVEEEEVVECTSAIA